MFSLTKKGILGAKIYNNAYLCNKILNDEIGILLIYYFLWFLKMGYLFHFIHVLLCKSVKLQIWLCFLKMKTHVGVVHPSIFAETAEVQISLLASPQLAPFNVKEQRLNSELLTSLREHPSTLRGNSSQLLVPATELNIEKCQNVIFGWLNMNVIFLQIKRDGKRFDPIQKIQLSALLEIFLILDHHGRSYFHS